MGRLSRSFRLSRRVEAIFRAASWALRMARLNIAPPEPEAFLVVGADPFLTSTGDEFEVRA